jgi:hypothetical protein
MAKTKKKTKKKTSRGKIKDPPFSKTLHKGTIATKGSIFYEYQDYNNILDTIDIFLSENNRLSNYVQLFKKDPNNAFLTIDLYNKDRVYPEYISLKGFLNELGGYLKNKKRYLIPIIVNVRYTKKDNHANMVIMNLKTMEIELFEPHGNRSSQSIIGGIEGGYKKKTIFVHKFFNKHFPEFKIININRTLKGRSFQVLHDPVENTGYCVTWCMLYTHYRILNPTIDIDKLIKYMDQKITTTLLLKYADYSENLLKDKN